MQVRWSAFFFAMLCACVLACTARGAHAEGAPLRPCQGPAPAPWVSNPTGVTQSVCHQSLLREFNLLADSALDLLATQVYGDGPEATLAGTDVVGIRDWHRSGPPPVAGDGLLDFSQARVVEQGHVGEPGELWWGRISGGSFRCCTVGNPVVHVVNADLRFTRTEGQSVVLVVGQESSMRLANNLAGLQQRMRFEKGELVPWPADAKTLQYSQYAATAVIVASSSDKASAPGSVSKASLELSVADTLSGTLHLVVTQGSTSLPVSIPLKRDVNEADAASALHGIPGNPFRLRQGRLAGDHVLDCHGQPGARDARPSRTLGTCYFGDQDETSPSHRLDDPQYQARGMFFGAEAEYLAIVYAALIPLDPARHGVTQQPLRGLVILKRTAVL